MNYIDNMNNLAKKHLNTLTADKFHPDNILDTMQEMYIQGGEEMDKKWRIAISTYCQQQGLNVSEVIMLILRVLNEGK